MCDTPVVLVRVCIMYHSLSYLLIYAYSLRKNKVHTIVVIRVSFFARIYYERHMSPMVLPWTHIYTLYSRVLWLLHYICVCV